MNKNSRSLKEIRLHGRGGQGAVFAATLAAEVVLQSGFFPQAFPFFGAERRGAPVAAFLRYSNYHLMPRNRVYHPDCAVAFDAELPADLVLNGLKDDGVLLINGAGSVLFSWNRAAAGKTVYAVDASHIAAELGLVASGIPLVSAVMVGALVRIMDLASLETMISSMQGKLPRRSEEENLVGARKGYQEVEEVKGNAAIS